MGTGQTSFTRAVCRLASPRFSDRRRGFGMLFGVIVLFLLMMMTMGVGQMIFGSRVASGTQAGVIGTIAVQLAHSAAQEAWRDIAIRANDRSDKLYRRLRKAIRNPAQAVVKFKVPVPETLAEIEATSEYSGFRIENQSVQAHVLGAGTMAGLTYENMGTFKITVRVSHKPTGIARTLHVTRGYKVALLSTPRPFDQTTLLIMNPQLLLDSRGAAGANDYIQQSIDWFERIEQQDKVRLIQRIERLNNWVNQKIGQENAQRSQEPGFESLPAGSSERFTAYLKNAQIPAPPIYTNTVEDQLHFFPTAPGDYVVYSLKDKIPNIGYWFLEPRVMARNVAMDQVVKQYQLEIAEVDRILGKIQTALENNDPAYKDRRSEIEKQLEAACKALGLTMRQLAEQNLDRLNIYKQFTDFFSERTGEGAKTLRDFAPKFYVEQTQKGRAFYRFEGDDAAEQMQRLLERYETADRPFNGIIHLATEGKMIRLRNRTFHGKIVLLVTGQVGLQDVKLQDPDMDLLTVQADDLITVEGTVEASIVAGGDIKIQPGAHIKGNLIMNQVYSRNFFQGQITRNKRYRSSAGGKEVEQLQGHFVVALSPKPASTIIERK